MRGAHSASTNAPQTTDTAPRAPQTMLSAPLSLAYAPDIYAVAPPHRDARNLTAANAFRAGADCTPNADHGCLDGTPYDYDTQFVCGSHTILKYSEEACCEQGRPFDTSAE